MKQGYQSIPNINPDLADMLRQSFYQPETFYITTSEPTLNNTKLGELKIYNDGTDHWIYLKVSKTMMIKFKGTAVT